MIDGMTIGTVAIGELKREPKPEPAPGKHYTLGLTRKRISSGK